MRKYWFALFLIAVFFLGKQAFDMFTDNDLIESQLPTCVLDNPKSWNNCQGTTTTETGNGTVTAKYVGEFQYGKMDGKGKLTYSNGDKYIGQFKDGNINGYGTFISEIGLKYVGEFINWEKNGHGTQTSANGEKYVGEFRNGKKDGQGTLYSSDGSIKQAGIWKENKLVESVVQALPSADPPPSGLASAPPAAPVANTNGLDSCDLPGREGIHMKCEDILGSEAYGARKYGYSVKEADDRIRASQPAPEPEGAPPPHCRISRTCDIKALSCGDVEKAKAAYAREGHSAAYAIADLCQLANGGRPLDMPPN